MWKKSFVATSVALGATVDDAVAALESAPRGHERPSASGAALLDPGARELVEQLRSAQRLTRAGALAKAVHDVVLVLDRWALR